MKKTTILLSLIAIGFGFGQDKGSFGVESQPMASRRIYIKHAERLALCDNTLPLNYHFNYLMLQTKSETLQIKRSFWKQAGIYGLEFAGAEIIAVPSTFISLSMLDEDYEWSNLPAALFIYFCGNIIGNSTSTWAIGKLLKQNGSWWKASVGSCAGVLISIFTVSSISGTNYGWVCLPVFLTVPSLGTVIGYNFQKE